MPSDSPSQNNEQPPFKGIGKFGPAAEQSPAPAAPPFGGMATFDPADEPADVEVVDEGNDVVSRGLRLHDILKGKEV